MKLKNLLLIKYLKTNLGAITDVSDQFVMINLKGEKVFDLFATGSPFNLMNLRIKKVLLHKHY